MAHTYTSLHYHVVFSTHGRRNLIPQSVLERLHRYLGGIVGHLKGKVLAVGGTTNHVHILASLASTASVAQTVGKIKANSSKWAHEEIPSMSEFRWQEGYAAFSVSRSQISSVADYIERQIEHHDALSFEEEFVEFLRRHGIEYDKEHVWG